jgi:hypothetical protein
MEDPPYIKPRRPIFFFQLKKENRLSWRVESSLNIQKSERQQNGELVKKGW